jgi:hypothetical protein
MRSMSNATQNNRQQCTERNWCDVPGPHHTGAHDGEADVAQVTATGAREAFVVNDEGGIIVPEVVARLVEQTEPSGVHPRFTIDLSVSTPHDGTNCVLTIHEADLLRRHLTQLLREVGADRSVVLS